MRAGLVAFLFTAFYSITCFADDMSGLVVQITEAGVKLGGTATKWIGTEGNFSWPPAAISTPSDQKAALETAIKQYRSFKATYQGELAAGKGAAEFFIDLTAATAAATGVGAVPAILLKGVAQTAADQFFEGEQKTIDIEMTSYLAKERDRLMMVGGTRYEDLRNLPPDQIKTRLAATPVLEDVENLAGDDTDARNLAQSLLIAGIKNTSMAELDAIAQQGDRLEGVEGRVGSLVTSVTNFQKSTLATLDAHSQVISSLQDAVGQLDSSINDINTRLTSMGRDQAVIADFVFERMDPAAKANALRAGFLADRFMCPDGGSECNAAKLKKDLISRYDQEAQISDLVEDARSTAVALSDVATIAHNVGLNIPALDTAVQLGSVASTAFSDIASGNYLGAVVAVTGLFGSRVDPEAERFKMLMSYLQGEFAQINDSLKTIIQNQQILLGSINHLAQQMADYYQALDEHLVRMEFEVKRLSQAAREKAWENWQPCFDVWDSVLTHDVQHPDEKSYGYESRQDFASLGDIVNAAASNVTSLRLCLVTALSVPTSVAGGQWFGNFLSALTAVQFTPDPLGQQDPDKYYSKDDLQNFIDNVHQPSLRVLGIYASRRKLAWARLAEDLSSPSPTIDGLNEKLAVPYDPATPCTVARENPGSLSVRLQLLLCTQDVPPDTAAVNLLSAPMVVDNAIDLADWMLLLGRLLSVYDEQEQRTLNIDEILPTAQKSGRLESGRRVVENARLMLDAATTSFSLIYGDLTAAAVLDVLDSQPETDTDAEKTRQDRLNDAKELLRGNPYLAQNVVLLRMRKHYALRNAKPDGTVTFTHVPPNALTYRTAYDFAVVSPENAGLFFRNLFDIDFDFTLASDGTPQENRRGLGKQFSVLRHANIQTNAI